MNFVFSCPYHLSVDLIILHFKVMIQCSWEDQGDDNRKSLKTSIMYLRRNGPV